MTQFPVLRTRALLKLSVFSLGAVLVAGPITAKAAETGKPLGSMLTFGDQAVAQMEQGVRVGSIRVEGIVRLERGTVLSYLTLKEGDLVSADSLNESLKALYRTGLFEDVKLAMNGPEFLVTVVENPVVNRITFEGNDYMSKEDLEKEIHLQPRLVYTLPKVQADVQRLLEVYRRSGRFAATIEPKIVKLEQNRVDVIFEIVEGSHTGVRRISFIGNDHYDESELRGVINTQESAWWKFFSNSDFYDPDRTNYDRELLRRFYLSEGYVDFRVVSSVAEMTPDREDFFMNFTIEEGARYKFGKIDVVSDIKGLNDAELKEQLLSREGEWYNVEKVEKTVSKLTAYLGDHQYAFVNIVPDVKKNKDTLTVDLTYHIKPGDQVYIGRINISGNTRTQDQVIRREMQMIEGDPYSASKIQKSEQKIRDLGYFETVKVSPTEGAQPDRSDLNVEVKEKPTGEVSMGAGFSSTDGPLGDFSIRERNFLGKGQDVRLGATVSGVTKQFDFSFTEPYFLERDLAAGVDVFHVRSDEQSQSSYDEINTGFSLRMNYPLSEQLRQQVSYTLRGDKISNVDSDASRFVREQEGNTLTSMVSQELTYDVRDSKLDPTEGFVTKLKTDLAGAGGDRKYYRVRLTGVQYYSPWDDIVFSATGEAGYIDGFSQDVRINDRFFLGSDTLRGFAYAGIGPRDLTNNTDDALGGNSFARGSLEMQFPTFMPKDLGFKAHVFSDFGVLGENDDVPLSTETFMSDTTLRTSVGLGVSWQSPFGLVRLDFGYPVMKEEYDDVEHVHFSFGTRF